MDSERRGWILTPDGSWHAVPHFLLDEGMISWPLGMPRRRPGEPVVMLTPDDFYLRHEVVEGEVYVFLRHNIQPADLPLDALNQLLVR